MSGLSLDIGKNRVQEPARRRPALPMVALAVLFSLLALLPLGFIIAIGIETGWETIKALVFRPRVAELLSNTLWLTALAVPLCIVTGVAIAWLTERTQLAGRGIWSALAVAPLAIPAFVQSYAWVSVVPSMHGLSAGVFLSVLAYYPFIYMPVAAVLRRLDPTLEDVAASLGTPPWKVFFRVVLPQLKLAICGGALLVALHLLAEYGLYVMIRFDTFTTAIYDQFQSTFSGPAANMLAGVLALCCLAILVLEGVTRGKARYARIGAGAAREQKRWPLKPAAAALGQLFFMVLIVLALGVPLAVLCRWIWRRGGKLDERRSLALAAPDADARRGRRAADDDVRDPHCVARYPLPAPYLPDAGRVHLYHQFAAGHCHGAGAGHRHHSLRTSHLPDGNYPVPCLPADVYAPCAHQPAGGDSAGAG